MDGGGNGEKRERVERGGEKTREGEHENQGDAGQERLARFPRCRNFRQSFETFSGSGGDTSTGWELSESLNEGELATCSNGMRAHRICRQYAVYTLDTCVVWLELYFLCCS